MDKCECSAKDEDQRIVVSTLLYAVYDLMSDKMKDYKQHINFPETAATSSVDVPTTQEKRAANTGVTDARMCCLCGRAYGSPSSR